MADIRFFRRLRESFPARYIGALLELQLGISIASGDASGAGTVLFFQNVTHVTPAALGLGFLLCAVLTAFAPWPRLYLYPNAVIFGIYAGFALYGWWAYHVVPPQGAIFAFNSCLFVLWAFPEGSNGKH